MWHGETKRLRGTEIDHEYELGWALDRQIRWFGTLQNPIAVTRSSLEAVFSVVTI
jgi:hypothetical protein